MPFKNSELIKLKSTESTNLYAMNILKSNALAEGSVVLTHSQTQGKGQGVNRWESEPGKNLTATIILYPGFLKPEDQFMLTRVVSLSVCSVLDKYEMPSRAMIKWPNDIYINQRKIAGILINNEITGTCISTTIAGVGLNINQESFSENAPGATSMKILTGIAYDLEKILSEWHESLEFWYKKLINSEFTTLEEKYLERMYLLNQPASYIIKGNQMEATIIGLAEYGMLMLKDNSGKQYICALQEVVFVK